jgi:hypothetical protein
MQTTGPSVDGRFSFFEISGFGGLYNILIMNNLHIFSSFRDGTKREQLFHQNGWRDGVGLISGCQKACYGTVKMSSE